MLNCEKQKLLDLVAFKFCAVSCLCVTCCCKSSVCNSMCLRSASDLWYSYFLFVFPSFFVLLYLQAQLRKVSHSFFTLLFLFSLSYSPPPPLLPPPLCSTHIYCVEDKGDTGREWSRKASCVYVALPLRFWVGRQLLCYVMKVDKDTHTHKRAKKRPVSSLGFHLRLLSNFLFFLICLFSILL